jgi:fructose-1,6-bisphosphatase/inositol monophosphatase family enzyme
MTNFAKQEEDTDINSRFIQAFRLAALQASCVSRRLQGEVTPQKKTDQRTPESQALTAVDLAAQDLILHLLHAALPEAAVDAEEDTDTVRLFASFENDRPLIIVDPIDGTLNYSQGSGDYAIMGALCQNGIYRAAVVHFPAWKEIYWAARGQGCWMLKEGGKSHRMAIAETLRLALQKIGLEPIRSRCSAVDASSPVTGRAAASVYMGTPGRRRAIGFLLTLEAGGVVLVGGRPWKGEDPLELTEDRKSVVVAESQETADRILATVK